MSGSSPTGRIHPVELSPAAGVASLPTGAFLFTYCIRSRILPVSALSPQPVMRRSARPGRALTHAALLAALLAAPARGLAQSGEGFLFGAPHARLTLRGGFGGARARGDLFDFTSRQLTLSRRDFSGITVGGDVGIPLRERLEVTFDLGYAQASRRSEFRRFVDNADRPIEQATRFDRAPLTANLRVDLRRPGRSIGRYAWIPTGVVPYVAAGAGALLYRFRQYGDFVDFRDSSVFRTELTSSGVAPVVQLTGGVDVTLRPRLALTVDARYLQSRGRLGSDFRQFDGIDLSGLWLNAGLTVRLP